MPRNTSGIYTLPGGNPVTPGDVIEAEWANTTLEDVADALTNSLSRTGAGGMLAPFRIADGAVSAPGLSYLNETNTGLYRSGSGSTWMAVLGVNVAQFSTVGLTIPFGKALTAQGNASVSGTLAVTGATTLGSSLAVTGALTATGGVVGNVTGNVTAASGSSSFNDVVITGSLDMTAGSSATITGLSTPTNASDAANKGYVDTQDALRLALTGGTMSGAIAMGNSKVTGLATPTADQDAATKAYVDSVAQGLDVKGSCRAATTANITLSGTQTIDGVAVIAGDRVLVKDQSSAAQNGIYVAAAGSWTRATDADTWTELVGAFTFVEEGTTNDNSGWVCTSPAGGTLGVTAVTWEQFSGAGQINAGAGMVKVGNTLNVQSASSSRIVVGTDEIDLANTGVGAGTYKSVTVDVYGRVTAGTNPTTISGFGITDAYTKTEVDTGLALKLNLTGGTMSGVIAMGANKITGLADPTNPQDAATKTYIDTIFGSTTTAAASAAAAASSASAAATSATNAASSATAAAGSATSAASSYTTFNNQYLGSKTSDPTVNNTGGALVAGNLYWNSTVNEMRVYTGSAWLTAYLPATGYLPLTGGTMTGAIAMSGNKITGLGAPAAATDAATKGYIDTALGSYLTSATAAATYQTIAGMSSYLTSATAASTYLPLTGGNLTGNLGVNSTLLGWSGSYKVAQLGNGAVQGAADSSLNVISNLYFNGTNWKYAVSQAAGLYAQYNGGHVWYTAPAGTAGANASFTAVMGLDPTGALGFAGSYGTSGQVLTSAGAGAPPTWASPAGGGSLLRTTVFTSSGTWTKGAGTNQIKVYGVGGGGGGGGSQAGYYVSGGGGAGGYFQKQISASGITTVTVTIGAGGNGGSGPSGAQGDGGGTTSFGAYCSGGGGGGGAGTGSSNPGGGSGANASGGDLNVTGGEGEQSTGWATGVSYSRSGGGGASYFGGGGAASASTTSGNAGQAYGSGGGGGRASNSVDYSGGAGKAGVVIVEEYA